MKLIVNQNSKKYGNSKMLFAKKCKIKDEYCWLKSKELYECENCGFRMSLKSGTVMKNSKLTY